MGIGRNWVWGAVLGIGFLSVFGLTIRVSAEVRYKFTNLGVPTDNGSNALAVSNSGLVVGTSSIRVEDRFVGCVFIWSQADGARILGTMGGSEALGYGINNAGTIAGYLFHDSSSPHAFRRSADGVVTELPDLV